MFKWNYYITSFDTDDEMVCGFNTIVEAELAGRESVQQEYEAICDDYDDSIVDPKTLPTIQKNNPENGVGIIGKCIL